MAVWENTQNCSLNGISEACMKYYIYQLNYQPKLNSTELLSNQTVIQVEQNVINKYYTGFFLLHLVMVKTQPDLIPNKADVSPINYYYELLLLCYREQ